MPRYSVEQPGVLGQILAPDGFIPQEALHRAPLQEVGEVPLLVHQGDFPAGQYRSLRVTLGEGEGHNWWCVVFPPLCLTAAETEAAFEELDEGTRAVISEDGTGVVFRFRLLELWGELREILGI